MSNIFDSLKEHLNPDLIGEAAKIYGESEIGIYKTITSLVPTILAGLLEKCGDSHSIDNIFGSLRNFDPAILNNLGSLLGGGNLAHNDPKDVSGQLLGTIFGAKVPAIANAVASFSGVKQSTASSLLGLAGPLTMGLLSKKISADGLNPFSLVSYLLSQRNTLVSMLPAGVGSLLGMSNAGYGNSFAEEKSTGGMGWLWPLLLLLALGIGIVYFLAM